MIDKTRKGLGRGLSALLGDNPVFDLRGNAHQLGQSIPIEKISPGKYQPRQRFGDEELDSLVESIKSKGILQPILVRSNPLNPDLYEIIAGERRWRAAQRAKLHEVPVIIRDFSDEESLEIGLVENLQRENLSPIEEARAYRRLMDEFANTQEVLAKVVGKSRSAIANTLRLLTLPVTVQQLVDSGELQAGHARALVGNNEAEKLAREIISKGLSVRQAELLTKALGGETKKVTQKSNTKDPDTIALENDLSNMLGLRVSITFKGDGSKGGSIAFKYSSLDQLDDILQRLNKE
jgi:ParB family chromosome partitioning protein